VIGGKGVERGNVEKEENAKRTGFEVESVVEGTGI
jgi:hypothetical protein